MFNELDNSLVTNATSSTDSMDMNLPPSDVNSQPSSVSNFDDGKLSIEEVAKQNPDLQRLLDLLHSQNISYEEYLAGEPELAKAMKLMTEKDFSDWSNISDEDLENDEEPTSFAEDEEGVNLNAVGDLTSEVSIANINETVDSSSTEQVNFAENVENVSEVSDDLNSIF